MNLDEALKILNVDFSNSFKFVKKRYKELVNKYHPDISKENDCLKQIQLINYAYEICKNNQLRFMIDIGELENTFFYTLIMMKKMTILIALAPIFMHQRKY